MRYAVRKSSRDPGMSHHLQQGRTSRRWRGEGNSDVRFPTRRALSDAPPAESGGKDQRVLVLCAFPISEDLKKSN